MNIVSEVSELTRVSDLKRTTRMGKDHERELMNICRHRRRRPIGFYLELFAMIPFNTFHSPTRSEVSMSLTSAQSLSTPDFPEVRGL